MREDAIKFYGSNDFVTFDSLDRVSIFIETFNHKRTEYSLTEVLDIFNVVKYIECEEVPLATEEAKQSEFKKTSQKIIGKNIISNELNQFSEEYKKLDSMDIPDFWRLFSEYKWLEKTAIPKFEMFVNDNNVDVYHLISHKKICDKFKVLIKRLLLLEPRNFELFLNEVDSLSKSRLFFPKNFTNEEISEWARRYCELPDANPNYLEQISQWSDRHEYKINELVLLKARREYEKSSEKILELGEGIGISISIGFKSGLKKPVELVEGSTSRNFKMLIDSDWIDENLDYPTILNNFIYIFGFFSEFQQFNFIKSGYESGSIIDIIKSQTKYQYKETLIFDINRRMFSLLFYAYYDYLAYKQVDLEEVFGYCYNELFPKELNNNNFFFNISDKRSSYYNRIKSLIPEFDSILKQFDLYQQYGSVDLELFEFKSKGKSYRQIGSLIDNKFIYLNEKESIDFCRLLFDPQSNIAFTKKHPKAQSFPENIVLGVSLDDFSEYQKNIIKKLLEDDIVGIDVKNQLYFKQIIKIFIYKTLWDCGYLSLVDIDCDEEITRIIEKDISEGKLVYGTTLFSEQESDYISYIIDNKKYNNGLEIRNKITHGNFSKKSSEEHKYYYLELLMILLLYTYRINSELDFEFTKNSSESQSEE
ncbi:hypothetical protein [Macrococcoides caseolyticum]|uniref:hypothetical protein n=1 Tax=Macrococcoides caseolyticum TaxID=69966 RepID=UPI000C3286F0|nr:hypothetical protein [Macrococcus caseolyticus]PKE60862.1 hypothetical protein CW669_06530 [Macrococcus caseolyticus]